MRGLVAEKFGVSLRLFAGILMICAAGCAQLPETPRSADVSVRMVEGGPLPRALTIDEPPGRQWQATTDAPWIALTAKEGAGSVHFTVTDAGWRKPGEYSGTVTIVGGATAKKTRVVLRIVPRAAGPKFTYVSPPQGCSVPGGVALPDPALCVVPDEKPPGNFSPPAAGGTYRDANFGAQVKVLAGPDALHAYSTPTPLSAHNRLALLGDAHGEASVVDVASGAVLSHPKIPFEGVVWDAKDDSVCYFIDGVRVVRFNVRTEKKDVLVNYGNAPWHFTSLTNGGSSDTTKDNWLGYYAPAQQTLCALDIASLKSYCGKYDAATVGMTIDPDNGTVLLSKGIDKQSGKRYVWIVGRPAGALYTVNEAAGKLDFEHLGPELPDWPGNGDGICQAGERCFIGDHFDMGEDANGIQYFFGGLETQEPCEYSLYSLQVNKGTAFTQPVETGGGRRRIMKLFRCGGDLWTDYHVGCAKASAFCVFSTTYGGFGAQRQAGDSSPLRRGPHVSEVIVVRNDGSEVRRLLEHRSVPLPGEAANAYWSTPRAAISNDGSLVVVDSNFGEANRHRVLLVETGLR